MSRCSRSAENPVRFRTTELLAEDDGRMSLRQMWSNPRNILKEIGNKIARDFPSNGACPHNLRMLCLLSRTPQRVIYIGTVLSEELSYKLYLPHSTISLDNEESVIF